MYRAVALKQRGFCFIIGYIRNLISLMRKIQMVDLLGQYEKIKSRVDAAVLDVVSSSAYINGPEVKAFQSELEAYLGVKHVIPCANGTDALQIALMALGLKPGDEVITSDFTFAATVEVIELLGLRSKLVDVEPDTFNIDVNKVREAIGPNTKAIVPVHLFGQCANMEPLLELAKQHGLAVVEDTAQAIGATYTFADGTMAKAGTMGEFGTTSFFPSKNLGCYGDGGALFTNEDNLAEIARSIANHGMGQRYYYDRIGVNSRLDSIQAAVLRIKLEQLDSYAEARNAAARKYDELFAPMPQLELPARSSYSNHVFHQYTLKTNGIDRSALQEFLVGKDIPAMIYYPLTLHGQKAYNPDGRYNDEDFPVTLDLCNRVISLPMHTELDDEQIGYIAEQIKQFLG